MFFLIDKKKRIIFGWSAKCGCSHVKNMFNFLTNKSNTKRLHVGSYNKLPLDHYKYKIIIIIRNPYERIVSGFLNKYCSGKRKLHNISPNQLTFKKFVNELNKNGLTNIDRHHFTPQLSEAWNSKIKIHRIYDIKKIDYAYIEKLYKTKIPQEIISFRGRHFGWHYTKNNKPCTEYKYVFNLPYHKYSHTKPKTKQFYNPRLAAKVAMFYRKDFHFFKSLDFHYNYKQ